MWSIEDDPIFDERNVTDLDEVANRSNDFVEGLLTINQVIGLEGGRLK